MKVELKEPQSWQRVFEVEVPRDQVMEVVEELYREYGLKAKIPGFRPGKVPRAILEARFGKGIEAEAIEKLVPDTYERALVQHNLVPINRAVISGLDLTSDKVLKFTATFEVLPPVAIKRYRGIPAVKKLRPATDDDVAKEIEFLQNLYAEYTLVDRAAAATDRVIIDYSPVADFPGSAKFKGQDYAVDLGAAQVLPEFSQGLMGAKAGDEKDIAVQYPADHPAKEVAGQRIGFKVLVKQVRERQLPALDDGFAAKVSEYQTLQELRDKIKAGLTARAEAEAMEQVRLQVMNAIITENPLELPDTLVAEEQSRLVADAQERHRRTHRHQNGATCDQCTLDEDKLRTELRPVAEWKIKQDLFLSHIALAEKVEAGPEEVDSTIRDIARSQRADPAQVRAALEKSPERMGDLKDRISIAKASEMLGQWAEVTVETATK